MLPSTYLRKHKFHNRITSKNEITNKVDCMSEQFVNGWWSYIGNKAEEEQYITNVKLPFDARY